MSALDLIDFKEKRVVLRVDLNVPIINKEVQSTARIEAILPTIEYILNRGGRIVLLSHLGRPKAGVPIELQPEYSLKQVQPLLEKYLNQSIQWIPSPQDIYSVDNQSMPIILCENVRIFEGEKENDPELGQLWASLGDIFINDAFSVSHREEASIVSVTQFIKESGFGLSLIKEIDALEKFIRGKKSPTVAIVGGSKVSTKLTLLRSLLSFSDAILTGGGITNTLIAAQGYSVGESLYEPELIELSKELLASNKFIMPMDVMVANNPSDKLVKLRPISGVSATDKIFDLGPETIRIYEEKIKEANSILWNGPLGLFESESFAEATKRIGYAITQSKAFSLAGGGDTVSAIEKYRFSENISYVSTAGGAFLTYLEGNQLPGLIGYDRKN